MSKFRDHFMSLSTKERERIAQRTGLSTNYLLKHMYVSQGDPKFKMHNATALDEASKGGLPFTETTEGDIDWQYVRRRLNTMHRNGEL